MNLHSRFPTYDHLVQSGLATPSEVKRIRYGLFIYFCYLSPGFII